LRKEQQQKVQRRGKSSKVGEGSKKSQEEEEARWEWRK